MSKTETEENKADETPSNLATITNIIPDLGVKPFIEVRCQNDKYANIKPSNRFYLHTKDCGAISASQLGAIFKDEDGKPLNPIQIASKADELKNKQIKVIADHSKTKRDGKEYDNWSLSPQSTATSIKAATEKFVF